MSANPYNPVSQIPMMGRKWSLTIQPPPNVGGTEYVFNGLSNIPEPMRIVFEVNIVGFLDNATGIWTARIDLYNLKKDDAVAILAYGQGALVTLAAGYQEQSSPFGIIFEGEIYEVIYERPDVYDSKVSLVCFTGLGEILQNYCVLKGDPQMTQAALIAKMASGAKTPIKLDPNLSSTMSSIVPKGNIPGLNTQMPRARAIFGDPMKTISRMVTASSLLSWYSPWGLGITPLSQDPNNQVTITYTSTTGILGVPQQTQNGVNFVVALDPRLRVSTNPPMLVNIANSIIRRLQQAPNGYRAILTTDAGIYSEGTYQVNGLQFRGDSRGNQWETEIVGLTTIGGKVAMIDDSNTPDVTYDPRSTTIGQ